MLEVIGLAFMVVVGVYFNNSSLYQLIHTFPARCCTLCWSIADFFPVPHATGTRMFCCMGQPFLVLVSCHHVTYIHMLYICYIHMS